MSNKDNILNNLSEIKLILILLVVIGHCLNIYVDGWFVISYDNSLLCNIAKWLGTFHIQTLFFLSGYLYYYNFFKKNKYFNFSDFFKRKTKSLLIPYILIGFVWVVPFQMYFFNINIKTAIKNIIFGFNANQLWFLLCLFLISLIVNIFLREKKQLNYKMIIIGCVLYFIGGIIPNVFLLGSAIKYFLFFLLGMIFKKNNYRFDNIKLLITSGILSVLIFSLFYYNNSYLIKTGLILICNLCGVLFILTLINCCFIKKGYIKQYSKKIDSFDIYLFHQQIIYVVVTILYDEISSFYIVIIAVIVSILFSVIISQVLSFVKTCLKRFCFKYYQIK